ncbi:MAG: recombination-associated protein RdgC [Steroidobacteraceae bacterium]
MWFKNLIVFRLSSGWVLSPGELEEQLSYRPLTPCSGYDMQTLGWVMPGPQERLVHTLHRQMLIALGVDEKILPASVINQVTKDRAAEVAAEQGYPVGRRQLREMKERVADELRARAFTRRSMTRAWLDPDNQLLVVDAASPAKAEELVATLRDTLNGFSAHLLETEKSPSVAMGAWLMFGDAPGRFNIENDLELQAVDGSKSMIKYVRHPLEGKEVQKHISSGKTPTRLGMSWNDRIAFILTADMQIKRLQFLDLVKDRAEDQGEAADEQFDIDFALMSGELGHMLKELIEVLGGEVQAGEQRDAA